MTVDPSNPNWTQPRWAQGLEKPDQWWAELFHEYAEQIAKAIQQSCNNDWHVSNNDQWRGLSLFGVFWAASKQPATARVRTAYLPSPGGTVPDGKDGYRRQRNYRNAIRQPRSSDVREEDERFIRFHDISARADEKKWNSNRRIFHLLFRPAVQWLRKKYVAQNTQMTGDLCKKLGRSSGLKFDSWLSRVEANQKNVEVNDDA